MMIGRITPNSSSRKDELVVAGHHLQQHLHPAVTPKKTRFGIS
jgi:hypothetical protein